MIIQCLLNVFFSAPKKLNKNRIIKTDKFLIFASAIYWPSHGWLLFLLPSALWWLPASQDLIYDMLYAQKILSGYMHNLLADILKKIDMAVN